MKEKKVKNESYITIQGFMINELNLKGNELLVYAIIYGFSQDRQSRFVGSLQYLADWTGATKQGIIKNLKALLDKGFIGKEEKYINDVKYVEYYATKFNRVLNSVEYPIKLSLLNNIENNIEYNIERKDIEKEKEIKKDKNKENNKIIYPTLEEIENYCKERNNNVNAKVFYDYYTTGGWKDSKGNKVKNWKQKVITWERKENNSKIPNYLLNEEKNYDLGLTEEQEKFINEVLNNER